jgi:acyl-CoA thioesterase FadM
VQRDVALARADVELVCVDDRSFRPARIPNFIKRKLEGIP